MTNPDGSTISGYLAPVAYTSGTIFDARPYGTVYLNCTVAPTAGTISTSPDNNADYVGATAVLNNASGITTTANITSAGTYSITGHVYVQATLTGGTCFIYGGQ